MRRAGTPVSVAAPPRRPATDALRRRETGKHALIAGTTAPLPARTAAHAREALRPGHNIS